jgi:GntR family transcriptional regulator
LYEILRDRIRRGEWSVGDAIPAEPELMAQFTVSRITVRQVLGRLVSEGLIVRRQGRGSFVAEPTLEQGLARILSFTEDMLRRGLRPSTRVLQSNLIAAPDDIAASLRVRPGDELAHLVRLRLADGEPLSIEETYLVHRLCPGVLKGNYAGASLRASLAAEYGLRLTQARQTIRAIAAATEYAHLLGIPTRSPLLFVERTTTTPDGVAVEFLRIFYRGDRYSLYAELTD